MNSVESWNGYHSMIPESSNWENKIPAKIFLLIPFYSPLLMARRVKCKSLIIAARYDSLIPVKAVKRTARRIKNSKLVILESNHFQPYFNEMFEKNIKIEIDFLREILTDNRNN